MWGCRSCKESGNERQGNGMGRPAGEGESPVDEIASSGRAGS